MTEIVVASIGGSGSRLMAQMLSDATGRPRCNDEFDGDWHGHILHTHKPYHEERDKIGDDFRAVFMLGHIGDAICSFYEGRIDIAIGARLMGVDCDTIESYIDNAQDDKNGAWMHLLKGDKLGWRDIILSWLTAPNTMTVFYGSLCNDPDYICELISEHVGYEIVPPKIIDRKSNWNRLPSNIRSSVIEEYDPFIKVRNYAVLNENKPLA